MGVNNSFGGMIFMSRVRRKELEITMYTGTRVQIRAAAKNRNSRTFLYHFFLYLILSSPPTLCTFSDCAG